MIGIKYILHIKSKGHADPPLPSSLWASIERFPLLHSNLQSSPLHFSPPPRFPYSHWLVVSCITSGFLFKCHPWVRVLPGLPVYLSVSYVAVLPSMKLLQVSTLTGSFFRTLSFSRPKGTHSLLNSGWFSVLTSVEEATVRRTKLLPGCVSVLDPASRRSSPTKGYKYIYTCCFSVSSVSFTSESMSIHSSLYCLTKTDKLPVQNKC